ncbi:Non-specific serine/threonine protein kinase [Bertholletia excelsa]
MMRLRIRQCFFVASFCCFLLLAVTQVTDPLEVSALIAIKGYLNDHWKHLKSWSKGDPCTSNWKGVSCHDTVGTNGYLHIRVLLLLNMNLSGCLAPELGQLSQLEILDFMWNDLSGSIPKEIGNIASLKLLLLNGNKLSGSLPDELGYLSNLNRFQIDQNQLSGPIPESFSNLSSVMHIHFNNNSLSGQIPSQLSNLSNLRHLLLDNNNLSGDLPPELSSLPELRILQLDNNNFNKAEIPASYGNLGKLVKLSLRNCSLQGAVPSLSMIPNLTFIDLSHNQLVGSIPPYQLSRRMTTIDMSNNKLNGSIPETFSDFPSLQKLSLKNNFLTGSVPVSIWHNMSFSAKARLLLDLQNNSFTGISGVLNPPANVKLRLQGNPICRNASIQNIGQFCKSEAGGDNIPENSTNPTPGCYIQSCPLDNYYDYVPASPEECFCASPLRIGYRLKSPSFCYFAPYSYYFEIYMTRSLKLELYQLYIDSYVWEGHRLWMYLKLFPIVGSDHLNIFNESEILRVRNIFASWKFPPDDFFGPYELLNFTLLGPYSYVNLDTPGKSISKGILIAIVLGAVACPTIISAVIIFLVVQRHQGTLSRRHLSSKVPSKIDGVKSFTFKEMALATDDFNGSTQVGQGGYGIVYRGILSDSTIVAIKRAKVGSLQGKKEFLTEIEMLSRLHHRNLVSLVGFCDEEEEQMLVYEFMPNGTLQHWLSATSEKTLDFGVRLRIALGSARGILYLHTEAYPPIFHRDIKASNILLDSKLTAKVADFGLSRLAPAVDDEGNTPNHVSTIVKGTPGYLDPEYLLTHKLTDKSDVYSLGVVFLEILTGMQPISYGKNIVREVNRCHQLGTIFSIIDSRMGSYPSESVERFVALALKCCQDRPEERPPMLDVVRELEDILQMTPETGTDCSQTTSKYLGALASSSSSANVSRDLYVSSTVSGSDLVSGVASTITPR